MEAILTPVLASIASTAAQGATRFQEASSNSDGGTDWPEALFITVAIAFGCIIAIVLIWQIFLTARKSIDSRADREAKEEMQALTQRSLATNEATANELAKISQGVTDLRVRLAEIEKVLREVE